MEIYETQARSLLKRLSARDRSQWPLHRIQTAVNGIAENYPKAQIAGKLGELLNDVRGALQLQDEIKVLPGGIPRKKREKGPRVKARTVPYLAGLFLRKRYGDKWTGTMTEADWTEFAKEQGYDASRVQQARAQLTAIFHGIRGWMDGAK